MAQRRQQMALAHAGCADGDNVDGVAQERAAAQVRHVLLDAQRKAVELQGMEGLLGWEVRLAEQARDTALLPQHALTAHHLGQVGLIR